MIDNIMSVSKCLQDVEYTIQHSLKHCEDIIQEEETITVRQEETNCFLVLNEAFLQRITNINRWYSCEMLKTKLHKLCFSSLSVRTLQKRMFGWKIKVQQLEDNFKKNRKKNQLVLQKKQESIKKFKEKCSEKDQKDPSLLKLLSGMIKDFDSRNDLALQEEKMFYESIAEHEHEYYQITLSWLQPLMKEVQEMLKQLDNFYETSQQHANDIIKLKKDFGKCKPSPSEGSDHESCKKDDKSVIDNDPSISQQQNCKNVVKHDEERAHSPYSIALSPKLVSKLTGRPPLPVQKHNPKHINPTVAKDPVHCETIVNRNVIKCFDISEVQGELTSPRFYKFPEQTENEKQIVFNCKSKQLDGNNLKGKEHDIFDSLKESQDNSCHLKVRTNLPHPVLVSDFRNTKVIHSSNKEEKNLKSINSEPSFRTKSPTITPVLTYSRPKTPPLKSIADQTAKAALIRTMITERLNSCSPVNFS